MRVLITSGQGPAECAFFLKRAVSLFLKESKKRGIRAKIESQGEAAVTVVLSEPMPDWIGVWEWRSRSPFRPNHKRARWFIEAKQIEGEQVQERVAPEAVSYQALRAGGPGGQHQNKTESAVRATWTSREGRVFSVTAREERSQHRNRKIAYERLVEKVAFAHSRGEQEEQASTHKMKKQVQRGDPVKSFKKI